LGAEPSALLERAARRAARFAEDFPSIACTETVAQLKFDANLKVLSRQEAVYDYLVLNNADGADFNVEESRLDQGKKAKPSAQPMLATTGFATLFLIFHPAFRDSYDFELLDLESTPAGPRQKIRFTHRGASASPTVLQVGDREYPIAWKGTAWLEPSDGMVTRIEAELREPLDDIGLVTLKAAAEYDRGAIGGRGEALWLPRRAVVELHTRHQHWRNTHEFSAFRRFEVSTDSKVEAPKTQ